MLLEKKLENNLPCTLEIAEDCEYDKICYKVHVRSKNEKTKDALLVVGLSYFYVLLVNPPLRMRNEGEKNAFLDRNICGRCRTRFLNCFFNQISNFSGDVTSIQR